MITRKHVCLYSDKININSPGKRYRYVYDTGTYADTPIQYTHCTQRLLYHLIHLPEEAKQIIFEQKNYKKSLQFLEKVNLPNLFDTPFANWKLPN